MKCVFDYWAISHGSKKKKSLQPACLLVVHIPGHFSTKKAEAGGLTDRGQL